MSTDLFCVNGHRLPQLFLLGAEKCGTTSMALQMKGQYGLKANTGRFGDGTFEDVGKEPHFFDIVKRADQGIEHYASVYPTCEEAELTFDASPIIFADKEEQNSYEHSFERLAEMYGPERLKHTTFAMLLCNPYRRAQSAYYYFAGTFAMCQGSNGYHCTNNTTAQFQEFFAMTGQKMTVDHPELVSATPFHTWVDGFADSQQKLSTDCGHPGPEKKSADECKDPKYVVGLGQYDRQVSKAMDTFGQLTLIAAPYFYDKAKTTIDQLLALVKSRGGSVPYSDPASHEDGALHEEPDWPGAPLPEHLSLEEDMSPKGLEYMKSHYDKSNKHIYDLFRRSPPGLTTIPDQSSSHADVTTTFLDPPAASQLAAEGDEPKRKHAGLRRRLLRQWALRAGAH